MSVIKFILLLAIIKSVISDKAFKLDPCGVQDIECLSKSTEQFLESTSAGIPAYDIRQIDPIIISEVSYKDPGSDILFHFKNIKVTGMKDQKMYDFKMDTQEKSVVLQTRIKADILTDVDVELTEASKNISGSYNIKASVIATAAYNYDLKPNDKGVEYFEVGPETITCVVEGDPEVTLDPKFAEAIAKDPDAVSRKDEYAQRALEVRKAITCLTIRTAYADVVHNIRASAKILPKTAFFKDM